MSAIITIADALVVALNAHTTFSQTFTAVRRYRPISKLPGLTDLTVIVCPKTEVDEVLSRKDDVNSYDLNIVVLKKVAVDDTGEPDHTATDALMTLVEEIIDFCRALDLGSAKCLERKWDAIYVPDHLDKDHVFTTVRTVTFKLVR